MSTQLKINEDLIQYLQNVGYRKDPLVDELEQETKALGKVAQMQIAKEQGQFLEIIDRMKYFETVEFSWQDIVRSGLVRDYIMTKEHMGIK